MRYSSILNVGNTCSRSMLPWLTIHTDRRAHKVTPLFSSRCSLHHTPGEFIHTVHQRADAALQVLMGVQVQVVKGLAVRVSRQKPPAIRGRVYLTSSCFSSVRRSSSSALARCDVRSTTATSSKMSSNKSRSSRFSSRNLHHFAVEYNKGHSPSVRATHRSSVTSSS